MRRTWGWLVALLLLLGFVTPQARADDVADLLRRLEATGARIVRVGSGDARLDGGRIAIGIGADGVVEVTLPEGGIRTPLRQPTRRMTVEEFRGLTSDMRAAIREVTGITVSEVFIAGSSTGIPFVEANGTVRTFDRKGPMTSDYDGAVISEELFALVERERPRAVRGRNTGLRTAPDPLPELKERFKEIDAKYGRKVAAMVYPNKAEFLRRMELMEFTVGVNVMPEPGPDAKTVEVTRAELVGALVEVEALQRLLEARGAAGRALLERARSGDRAAAEELRALRRSAATSVGSNPTALDAVDRDSARFEGERLAAPEGFASRRAAGPAAPLLAAEGGLHDVFDLAREGSLARALERAGALSGVERAEAMRAAERVGNARLEIVESGELLVEYRPETNTVRASTAALNKAEGVGGAVSSAENLLLRNKALGLLFAHELAHAGGVRSERVADAEAVRVVERTPALTTLNGRRAPLSRGDLRRTIDLFARGGDALSDALYALKNLPRYGTSGGRESAMNRALEGRADPLARYRRTDGTLEWSRLSADKALVHGAGVAHFALALFLKELAVVVKTGDRMRIDELFDGLLTTDFFVTYGLFSAGAHAGNVAYSRFLARHVKPRFVSGVLRTNIVLATGLALPDIVRGEFDGKTFAINLTSLGLSATAVRAGLAGIDWVLDLKRLRESGRLAIAGSRLRHLARFGGWFYTAVETAVVLYFGDEIAKWIGSELDERAARGAVGDATEAAALAARSGDAPALREKVDALRSAHEAWRNHLLSGLAPAEALYVRRLEASAREAKIVSDRADALRARLTSANASLRESLERRNGSLEDYVTKTYAGDYAAIEADLRHAMTVYERSRAETLREAYSEGRRDGGYLEGVDLKDGSWLGRVRLRRASRDLSENRLQAYDDELAALRGLRALTSESGRAVLDEAIAQVEELERRDAALFAGAGNPSGGALEALEGASR